MRNCAEILIMFIGALQASSADRVDTPTGKYQLVRLHFEKGAPTKERHDVEELLPFREGKASTPSMCAS
jgi:hypothetical protein